MIFLKDCFFIDLTRHHHVSKSVQRTPWKKSLYTGESGVYRGIHVFLILAQKQRLWVPVKTPQFDNSDEQKVSLFGTKIRKISSSCNKCHFWIPEILHYMMKVQ